MTSYDVGDAATLTTRVYDTDGTLTNATVALSVTDPDGSSSAPSVTNDSTGIYSATLAVDLAGIWFYTWTVSGNVTAVDSGQFTASDPLPPLYASLDDLRTHLNLQSTDVANDGELLDKLVTACRRIDTDTGRPHGFWADSAASARTYRTTHEEILLVDDISSTTGLIVEVGSGTSFSTLSSSYYETWPENAIVAGKAIEAIRRVIGCWSLGYGQRVRVTAKWGWPKIPEPIHTATLLLAARLFRRKNSPEGIAGSNEFGGVVRVSRYDSDYDALIGPYIKPVL